MRGLSSDILNNLAARENKLILVVESEWRGGNIYFTNFSRNIIIGGNEYQATGALMSVSNIEESLKLQAVDGQISLSGLPETVQAIVQEEFINGKVKISIALLDSSDQIIDQPILLQEGYMNTIDAADDYENSGMSVSVNYTSLFARFEDIGGRRSNPSEHKNNNPNDEIFDSVPTLTEKILDW